MQSPVKLLILIWVPFLSVFAFSSPALVDEVGDSYPHLGFHVFSLLLLVPAFLTARALLPSARTRTQRVCTRILLVLVPFAVLGNVVELGAAFARFVEDGWRSLETPEMFEEGVHLWGANLTIPALMLSMVTVLVLVVASVVQGRRLEPVR